MITQEQRNRAQARIAAKEFIALVRNGSGFAHSVPDAIFDRVPEGQEQAFIECLLEHRLVQRPDGLWEAQK